MKISILFYKNSNWIDYTFDKITFHVQFIYIYLNGILTNSIDINKIYEFDIQTKNKDTKNDWRTSRIISK